MGNPRELASAFSTRLVREMSRPQPALWARERIAPIAGLVDGDAPLSAAFEVAYGRLVELYQCEYVYATELIAGALKAEPDAHAITGLPVFLSIADVVVAGNSASAFEIKTGLDSFARLELQLFSYSRSFEYVHVVTSQAKAPRAVDEVPEHVGVIAFDDSAALTTVRAAAGGYSRLDIGSVFRVLRRAERLAILERQIGYEVDAPSALLYQRTAELFTSLPIEAIYDDFVAELKGRDARQRAAAADAGLPRSLVAAASGLTLSGIACRRLGTLLQRPAGQLADATRGWAA
ncbi:Uncharacterised protein [Mycobacteroides abscessus subsp. abscessus]|uniref:sce7726 family protein n=1 Tax=Mycobacteroides abscessus TaxID=36809 RepID=UPI000928EC1C|nr:sce7726 family protein [Mycobacteroides abscessus]SHU66159.1 Uncharacterised protein [Mycobacteroides abscessus subsp. abscessus]